MEELVPEYEVGERVEFEEIPVPEFEREREFGVPEEWPKFPVGRVIVIDGVQFEAVSYTHLTLPTTPYV